MAYTEQKFFYELLVRGTADGIAGAHALYLERTLKDGVVIAERVGDAIPVALAKGDPGMPIAEVLGEVNVQALATMEALTAEKQAALDAKTAAEAERDEALGRLQTVQAQLAEFLTPVDENGVPKEVTMRQAQLALLGAGLLDKVEAAIAAIPGDAGKAAQITWTKSATVKRDNPLIAALKPALNLSDAQIDGLFLAAAKL